MCLEVVLVNRCDWSGIGQFNGSRIVVNTRYKKFVMKMGAGGPARLSYETDHLSLLDGSTTLDIFCEF